MWFYKKKKFDLPDIGFAFLETYIGKGFATESATVTLQIAKEKFNHSKLCAITNNDNFKSIKLLEKIGFSFQKTIEMDNEVLNYYTN